MTWGRISLLNGSKTLMINCHAQTHSHVRMCRSRLELAKVDVATAPDVAKTWHATDSLPTSVLIVHYTPQSISPEQVSFVQNNRHAGGVVRYLKDALGGFYPTQKDPNHYAKNYPEGPYPAREIESIGALQQAVKEHDLVVLMASSSYGAAQQIALIRAVIKVLGHLDEDEEAPLLALHSRKRTIVSHHSPKKNVFVVYKKGNLHETRDGEDLRGKKGVKKLSEILRGLLKLAVRSEL
eukprot:Platyproteum_vivax@DN2746_c0_g1_i2.p1